MRHNGLGVQFDCCGVTFEVPEIGAPDESTVVWPFMNADEGAAVIVFVAHRDFRRERDIRDYLSGFIQGLKNTAEEQGVPLLLDQDRVAWSGSGGEATVGGHVGDGQLSVRMFSFDRKQFGFPFVITIQVVSTDSSFVQEVSGSFSLSRQEKSNAG